MNDQAHRYRRASLAASVPLGVVLGLLAESASGMADPEVWVPDLAVGWTFIACGVIACWRRPETSSGLLMLATGLTWFLPNFGSSQVAWLAWLGDHTVYLHRGPLIQLLVTFPTGRPSSRLSRAAVGLGYLSAVTLVWAEDRLAVPLAIALLVIAAVDQRRLRGPARRARAVGLRALGLTMLALAVGALARVLVGDDQVLTVTRWATEVVLCVVPVWLLASLLAARWERAAITDLVVEMGTSRSDRLRDDLARALGDPSLEVGYWAPDRADWVDSKGMPFSLPLEGSGRVVTSVAGMDGPLAVLVHDPAVLDDSGLVADIRAAAELAAANARLQAEVRGRVADLAASRRRLLDAADDERRRLEQRLHDGARQRLETLATTVADARSRARGSQTNDRLDAVDVELQGTLADLDLLGRGLHPRELGELGLSGALEALAARMPLTVSVTVTPGAAHPAPEVAAAAYYLCSEALANSAKHAAATAVRITLGTSNGHLTVEVADDGVGGAESVQGSGLRGLSDRMATLGGSLSVLSPPGSGTRLVARIPLSPSP